MAKQFFYDLETTGVNPAKNGIHQIAAIIVIDGEEKERINIKIQPNPKAIIEDDALKVGNVTREQLATYTPFVEGYNQLRAILGKYVNPRDKTDKFHLIGFNNRQFDDQFLRGLFLQNDDKYFGSWFWSDSSDVMVLASECLKDARHKMDNFKLSTVVKFVGLTVDEEKLHDAFYDLEITQSLYSEIKNKYFNK